MNWGIFGQLLRWFDRYITKGVPDPEPATYTTDGNIPTQITIHATPKLRANNGKWSEKKVATALQTALKETDLQASIKWGLKDTIDPPTEDPYTNDFESIHWFKENGPQTGGVHLLLSNARGGVTVGNYAIGGAREIFRFSPVKKTIKATESDGIHACLHEVGHALGVGGDGNNKKGAKQTYGKSWIENGYWYRSLATSTDKQAVNACGESIAPNDENLPVMLYNRYSVCAIKRMETTQQS